MEIDWQAVAAVATSFAALVALLVALFRQDYMRWRNLPIIEFGWFERTSPHLVQQAGVSVERTGLEPYQGMFMTFNLTNKGKGPARDAEVQLTTVAKRTYSDKWEKEPNWVPIPLKWVLPSWGLVETAQRDLFPERSYLCSLASFSAARDGELLITYFVCPVSQRENFPPGEYCFEVSVFATDAPASKRYIYVTFEKFSGGASPDTIKDFIRKVEMKNSPPW